MNPSAPDWFRAATIYQVYPRSFQDSTGSGLGDLRGITSRLDYLKDLGIDALWLCPVYASPNDDNGYDISDYQAIHPDFGTMDDFDALLAGLHARGMRLIMDIVINHSSDEHAWFVESRSSLTNPKRDWYHWQPANADGGPPNHWQSFFSGSAWQKDEVTGEYFLHLFSKKQPDLNWENPDLRQATYAMMRWWLAKGVDGLRLDVINLISKREGYPEGSAFLQCANGPRVNEFFHEMHQQVFAPFGAVTVGETPGASIEHGKQYTDPQRQELNMIFQFELMDLGSGPNGKFELVPQSPAEVVAVCQRWQEGLDDVGWNSLYWNNHDQPRLISRFGDPSEAFRELSGKALATFLYLQKGTAFVYQGEEIGMINLPWNDATELRDIESLNFLREAALSPLWPGDKAWRGVLAKGRDNARTPLCWDATPGAGFTAGTPWIRVHPQRETVNVEESRRRPDSLWHFYRELIRFRREEPLIASGSIRFVVTDDPAVAVYRRFDAQRELTVVVNLSSGTVALNGHEPWNRELPLRLRNYNDVDNGSLRPWELRVFST